MRSVLILPMLSLGLASCADSAEEARRDEALIARDPVIARALHDPLMTDPDLASRNEANAAIGFPDSNALPVIAASPEDALSAREALRLELMEAGLIPVLPAAPESDDSTPSPPPLGPMTRSADLIAAVGAPAACAAKLREDFAIAANLPAPAAIPQGGMVVQAGGADVAGCALRIIRYQSAAPAEDVLHYHYACAVRSGLTAKRLGATVIAASGKGGERLTVHVRDAAHGLTGVTLVYRAN